MSRRVLKYKKKIFLTNRDIKNQIFMKTTMKNKLDNGLFPTKNLQSLRQEENQNSTYVALGTRRFRRNGNYQRRGSQSAA